MKIKWRVVFWCTLYISSCVETAVTKYKPWTPDVLFNVNDISYHNVSTAETHHHPHIIIRRTLLMLGQRTPILITEFWPGADPSIQAVSPQVTLSHFSGRLPLLSTRPAVTFYSTITKRWARS